MAKQKLCLYCFGAVWLLYACCSGNDDIPIDNTVHLQVFNLDKSDNLLDDEGPIIFDAIKLRYADTNEELGSWVDQTLGEIAFLPLASGQETKSMDTSELLLELDSLSYPLSIKYRIEEIRCAGTEIRVESYNFEGQEFVVDENVRYNKVEVFIDL